MRKCILIYYHLKTNLSTSYGHILIIIMTNIPSNTKYPNIFVWTFLHIKRMFYLQTRLFYLQQRYCASDLVVFELQFLVSFSSQYVFHIMVTRLRITEARQQRPKHIFNKHLYFVSNQTVAENFLDSHLLIMRAFFMNSWERYVFE